MKTKHTPGPWTMRIGDEWSYSVVTDHGELPDGDRSYWTVASVNTTRDEKAANLRLIAAAPDLLEALKELCDAMHSHGFHFDPSLKTAEAVIAKATGGTP